MRFRSTRAQQHQRPKWNTHSQSASKRDTEFFGDQAKHQHKHSQQHVRKFKTRVRITKVEEERRCCINSHNQVSCLHTPNCGTRTATQRSHQTGFCYTCRPFRKQCQGPPVPSPRRAPMRKPSTRSETAVTSKYWFFFRRIWLLRTTLNIIKHLARTLFRLGPTNG